MEPQTNRCEDLELILQEQPTFTRSAAGVEAFSGYAAVFYDPANPDGTSYQISPKVKERIDPRAFDHTDLNDVELWFEHSNLMTMGEVRTKSLFLSVDKRGLHFDCPFDGADPDHARAVAKIKRGRVNGASIRFNGEYTVHKEGSFWIRTIKKIFAIPEFSLVNKPAYKACAVNIRSAEVDAWTRTEERIARAKNLLGS